MRPSRRVPLRRTDRWGRTRAESSRIVAPQRWQLHPTLALSRVARAAPHGVWPFPRWSNAPAWREAAAGRPGWRSPSRRSPKPGRTCFCSPAAGLGAVRGAGREFSSAYSTIPLCVLVQWFSFSFSLLARFFFDFLLISLSDVQVLLYTVRSTSRSHPIYLKVVKQRYVYSCPVNCNPHTIMFVKYV